MPDFKITPRAGDDLKNIGRYTLKIWGKKQRDIYLRNLDKRFQWLAQNPKSGKHRPDIQEGYYCFPQGSHLVFYIMSNMGRMILAAQKEDCLTEILIIAAALSIQDPRERPMDARQQADEQHQQFQEPSSDFLSYLNIWTFFEKQHKQLSQNQLRKLCRAHFLSYVRMREWRDIHQQLLTHIKNLPRYHLNTVPAPYDVVATDELQSDLPKLLDTEFFEDASLAATTGHKNVPIQRGERLCRAGASSNPTKASLVIEFSYGIV